MYAVLLCEWERYFYFAKQRRHYLVYLRQIEMYNEALLIARPYVEKSFPKSYFQ